MSQEQPESVSTSVGFAWLFLNLDAATVSTIIPHQLANYVGLIRIYEFPEKLLRAAVKAKYRLAIFSENVLAEIIQDTLELSDDDLVFGKMQICDRKKVGRKNYADIVDEIKASSYPIDLERSVAFGSAAEDIPCLDAVNWPICFEPEQSFLDKTGIESAYPRVYQHHRGLIVHHPKAGSGFVYEVSGVARILPPKLYVQMQG